MATRGAAAMLGLDKQTLAQNTAQRRNLLHEYGKSATNWAKPSKPQAGRCSSQHRQRGNKFWSFAASILGRICRIQSSAI
jgi:hypothetical protein